MTVSKKQATLIIPAAEESGLYSHRIAGLQFSERIRLAASRAGFHRTVFLSPGSPWNADEWQTSSETQPACFAVIPQGILPDTHYLESLLNVMDGEDQLRSGAPVTALIHCTHHPKQWLEKIFSHLGSPEFFQNMQEDFPTRQLGSLSGRVYEIQSPESIPQVEDLLFKGLVKDTEGFMSIHVERKISLTISRLLVNTSITPNQMTLFSILVGVVGAYLIGTGAAPVLGAFLFLAHSILDGCDGELARVKFLQKSLEWIVGLLGRQRGSLCGFFCSRLFLGRKNGGEFPLYPGRAGYFWRPGVSRVDIL